MKKNGFTMIELLVVLAVLGIIAAIGGEILMTVIRTYNKANIIGELQQNGNYVLSQLEEEIRESGAVSQTSSHDLTVVRRDESTVTYSFIEPSGSGGTCVNGRLERSLDGGAAQVMTNTDNKGGINVIFTTPDPSAFEVDATSIPNKVNITLKISQACNASTRIDYQAETVLKTTVSLRTY